LRTTNTKWAKSIGNVQIYIWLDNEARQLLDKQTYLRKLIKNNISIRDLKDKMQILKV